MKTRRTILATLAFMGWGGLALAQSLPAAPGRDLSIGTSTFNVRTMDFDLWCQQTQRYAADRCAARRAEDVKAFEDYRSSIERYELDYLKQVQKDQNARPAPTAIPARLSAGNRTACRNRRRPQNGPISALPLFTFATKPMKFLTISPVAMSSGSFFASMLTRELTRRKCGARGWARQPS